MGRTNLRFCRPKTLSLVAAKIEVYTVGLGVGLVPSPQLLDPRPVVPRTILRHTSSLWVLGVGSLEKLFPAPFDPVELPLAEHQVSVLVQATI